MLSVFQRLNADENLYALVFGESVLNDAVAITLYRTFLSFLVPPFQPTNLSLSILSTRPRRNPYGRQQAAHACGSVNSTIDVAGRTCSGMTSWSLQV